MLTTIRSGSGLAYIGPTIAVLTADSEPDDAFFAAVALGDWPAVALSRRDQVVAAAMRGSEVVIGAAGSGRVVARTHGADDEVNVLLASEVWTERRLERPEALNLTLPETADSFGCDAPVLAGVVPAGSARCRFGGTGGRGEAATALFDETVDVEIERAAMRCVDGPRRRAHALVGDDGTRILLDAPVELGRGPAPGGADTLRVSLTGSNVSRRHAMVHVDGWAPRLEDLGSTNGTAVEPVGGARRLLELGDVHVPAETRALLLNNRFDAIYQAENLLHADGASEHVGHLEHDFWGGWSGLGHDEQHYIDAVARPSDQEVAAWLDETGRAFGGAGLRFSAAVPDPTTTNARTANRSGVW